MAMTAVLLRPPRRRNLDNVLRNASLSHMVRCVVWALCVYIGNASCTAEPQRGDSALSENRRNANACIIVCHTSSLSESDRHEPSRCNANLHRMNVAMPQMYKARFCKRSSMMECPVVPTLPCVNHSHLNSKKTVDRIKHCVTRHVKKHTCDGNAWHTVTAKFLLCKHLSMKCER